MKGVEVLTQYEGDDARDVWILHRQPDENSADLRERLLVATRALSEQPQEPSAVPEQVEGNEPPQASSDAGVDSSLQSKIAELKQLAESEETLEAEAAAIKGELADLRKWTDEALAREADVDGRLEVARKAKAELEAARKLLNE